MYTVVLVPLKNDPGDAALLRHAAQAAGSAGASLVLLHAIHSHSRDATAFLRTEAEAFLGEMARSPLLAGLDVSTLVIEAEPAEAIRGAAATTGADLIVMGSHGHSQVRHVLLGSVTEAVIRGSALPVLVVRPEGA